jgi:hypothetical protein
MEINRMRIQLTTALGLAALLALTGCGDDKKSSNKVPERPEPKMAGEMEGKSPMDIFPTTPGAQSVYQLTTSQGVREVTFLVKDTKPAGNGQDITLDILNDGEITDTVVWRLSEKGLSQVSARKGVTFDPPQSLVTFPIKFSEDNKYEGDGPYAFSPNGGKGPIEGQSRIRGLEIVETKMGEIEALAIDAVYRWKNSGDTYLSRETAWIAPKYGIVKFNQTVYAQNAEGETQAAQQALVLAGFTSP